MSATRKKKPAPEIDESESSSSAKKSSARPDEMSEDVMEFITAIDEYKRLYQRPFPSWSEVLEIVKGLGYERAS